jgi:hypothetical protein
MLKPWASHNYTKMHVDYRHLERDERSSRSVMDLDDRQGEFRERLVVIFPILL